MGWCCTRLPAGNGEGCGCSGRAAAVIPVLRAAKRLRQGARWCAVPDGVPCCQGRVWAAEKDQEAAAASCPARAPWRAITASSSWATIFCSLLGSSAMALSCCSMREGGPRRDRRSDSAAGAAPVSSPTSTSMEVLKMRANLGRVGLAKLNSAIIGFSV